METLKKYYEIKQELNQRPFAMVELKEAWVESETGSPVRISSCTILNMGPSNRALLEMMCQKTTVYAMQTGEIKIPISKNMFESLAEKTQKPMLKNFVLCFKTREDTIVKTGTICTKTDDGLETKLNYAEVAREFEEIPDETPDLALYPEWKPIDSLDAVKYQIYREQA